MPRLPGPVSRRLWRQQRRWIRRGRPSSFFYRAVRDSIFDAAAQINWNADGTFAVAFYEDKP